MILARSTVAAGRRAFSRSAVSLKEAAPAAPSSAKLPELTLNFALPHKALVGKREVKRVTVPGRDGALGVERGTPSIVTELKAGVVRVDFMDGASEEYFVPGGFAFKHANNMMDISAPEGVKADAVDADALRAGNKAAAAAAAAAPAGSKEAALAKAQLDVYKALAQFVKVTL